MSATADATNVTLARTGKVALPRLDKQIDAAQDALLKPLSTSERRELRRLLQKLLQTD